MSPLIQFADHLMYLLQQRPNLLWHDMYSCMMYRVMSVGVSPEKISFFICAETINTKSKYVI